jgi:prepilin-type N-terminal cleavage/methylation domain-containing protein
VHKKGFSLLEVMLALVISSGIMIGLMQSYRSAERYLRRTNAVIRLNRSACLLFNQLERDFTTAYMGPFLSDEKTTPTTATAQTQPDKPKEQLNVFTAVSYEDIRYRKEEHVAELFKNVSLINTSPLTIANEHRIRLVRVVYELVEDKKMSRGPDQPRYTLTRKETYNLRNNDAKEQLKSSEQATKFNEVRSHIIARNVVNLFVSYLFLQNDKKPAKPGAPVEDLRLANTKKTKEKLTSLPYLVEVECTLEDPDEQMQGTYRESFPIIAYSLPAPEKPATQGKPNTDETKKNEQAASPGTQSQTGPTQHGLIQPERAQSGGQRGS